MTTSQTSERSISVPPTPPFWKSRIPPWVFWVYTVSVVTQIYCITLDPRQPTWLRLWCPLTSLPMVLYYYLEAYQPHVWPWRNRPLWRR